MSRQAVPADSDCVKLTRHENTGFKYMVKVLEPSVVILVLPCINEHKLQLLRNYQQVRDGALLTFVLLNFLIF